MARAPSSSGSRLLPAGLRSNSSRISKPQKRKPQGGRKIAAPEPLMNAGLTQPRLGIFRLLLPEKTNVKVFKLLLICIFHYIR